MNIPVRVRVRGREVEVRASERAVSDWLDGWPCSGMSARPVQATFEYYADGEVGDLLDHNVPEDEDGAALVALLEDMQDAAQERLR